MRDRFAIRPATALDGAIMGGGGDGEGAATGALPTLGAVPHPRLAYLGPIDGRLDYELVRGSARLRPGWHWLLIGPVAGRSPASSLPNVHLIECGSAEDPCRFLPEIDVAILPVDVSSLRPPDLERVRDCVEAGVPVVWSAPPNGLVGSGTDLFHVGTDLETFGEACLHALIGARSHA